MIIPFINGIDALAAKRIPKQPIERKEEWKQKNRDVRSATKCVGNFDDSCDFHVIRIDDTYIRLDQGLAYYKYFWTIINQWNRLI